MSSSPVRLSCHTTNRSPLPALREMRGKSLVRMNAPGMHCSGPRPKLQRGSPTTTSSPTLTGLAQLRWAVPSGELPVGWQVTARFWTLGSVGAVLPLWKATVRLPSLCTIGSEPLVEVTGVRRPGRVEEVAQEAQRLGAADLLGRRPGHGVVG